ncbi:MAG: hypothetical protein WC254_04145 [Candidatus Woesearchaeota archaeon]|jgi:peptidoglycan hydrolase CwlO-like protein
MTVKGIQKIRVYGIFLLLILLSGAMSTSAEDVIVHTTGAAVSQFYSYSSSYTNACAGILTTDSLIVKNQGTVSDTYYITIQGEVAQWISVSTPILTLKPGEQQEVTLYISTPYKTAETYEYTVEIASTYDSTKKIEKTLSVAECPNINVKGYPSSQQSCPCSTAVYIFQVSNTGADAETYTLYLDGIQQDYYDLSEYSITLQPHETTEIYAYVRMACYIYGDFDFTLIAETINSKYTAELPLVLDVQQACYDYNINLGEALVFSENEPLALDFTPTADRNYILCQETPAVIPVQIQNPGEIMNEYTIKIEDAEQWISPAEPYIRLTENQEKITNLVVNTAAADIDTYSFALKVDTLRGDLQTVIPFTIEVQDCTPDGLPAWLKYTLWSLLGIVILAILVAAYFLLKKSDSTSTTNKTTQAFKKYKKWLFWILPLLLLFILFGIFAYPHIKEYSTSSIPLGELWNSVETVLYNWATVLIIIVLLLILAFLLWYFKFRKKNGKNHKKINGKERWKSLYEKIKPYLKWVWIILLLLILLTGLGFGGYYLYTNYQEDSQKFLEETQIENITTIPEEETITTNQTIIEVRYDNETITALEEQLAEIQKNITDKDQQITSLQIEILKLAEQAAAAENATTLDMYTQQIQELQDRIQALEDQLAALQQQEADYLTALNAMDAKITAVDNHVTDLEERINDLEEQITALQTMIAQLSVQKVNETIINETQEELANLTEQKNDLEEAQDPYNVEVPIITDESYETTLIFDVSLSGQIVENGVTRFQRGVEAATKYIQEKGIYNIMIVGKNPIIISRDTNQRDAMRIIHYLRPIDTQSNLGNALYAAAQDFHGIKEGRIVLISDMKTTDNTDLLAIHDELENLGMDVIFIDISFKETAIILEGPVQETEELEGQESPYFDIQSQTAETFQIDIPMNSEYSLDLNTYFSDEDNDVLQYSAKTGEHLLAVIRENLALLTPERDWTGKTTVVFGADDGKEGYVESPALVVNVFTPELLIESEEIKSEELIIEETVPEESQEQNDSFQSYIPTIIIGSIILLIVVSLIIGAFIKRYQTK